MSKGTRCNRSRTSSRKQSGENWLIGSLLVVHVDIKDIQIV